MFKFAIAMSLCLGAATTGFAEVSALSENPHQNYTTYMGGGYQQLKAKNYGSALPYFQKASDLLDQEKQGAITERLFISFYKVIAYDGLGRTSRTKEEIGNLFILVSQLSDEEEDRADQAFEKESTTLKELAQLAPTPEIRNFLFFFID